MSLTSASGSSDVLQELIDTTMSLKSEGGRPADERVDAIIKDLEPLKDSAAFFKSLKDLKFWSSLHCEATLACFMLADSSKLPKEYKVILVVDELSVIVSSPH